MNKKSKQLKHELRGTQKLKAALTHLRWTAWLPPSEEGLIGSVIGQNDFVEYVAGLILADLKSSVEDYKVVEAKEDKDEELEEGSG